MAKKSHQPTRVEDVLERLEAREKVKNRRRTLTISLVTAGILGAGVAAYTFMNQAPKTIPQFAYADINRDKLPELLDGGPQAILVSHPDVGVDTIRSVEDYEVLRRNIELSNLMDQQSQRQEADTLNRLQPFVVDVAGRREAGERLVFTIEGYDPEVRYMLDFGNGQRREADERTTYRYPLSGNFKVTLFATKGEASSLYSKRFRITAASKVAEETERQTPAIPVSEEVQTDLSAVFADEPGQVQPLEMAPELLTTNDPQPSIVEDLQPDASQPDLRQPAEEEPAIEAEEPDAPAEPAVSRPLMISEVEPTFPGGSRAMMRFIQRNYRYPSAAQDNLVEGMVIVRFVVEEDGGISNVSVVKGIGYGCDQEATRLVKAMPNWIPGEQGGTKVPVYRTIPISFRLLK